MSREAIFAAEQADAARLGIHLDVNGARLNLLLRCDCGEVHPDSGDWSLYRGVVRELHASAKHDGWAFFPSGPQCPECSLKALADVVRAVEADIEEANQLSEEKVA